MNPPCWRRRWNCAMARPSVWISPENETMPASSFRLKLLLSMALVVAVVSVVTLLVTQQRVRRNYETLFKKQFQRQIAFFGAMQETRLQAIQEHCLSFSHS